VAIARRAGSVSTLIRSAAAGADECLRGRSAVGADEAERLTVEAKRERVDAVAAQRRGLDAAVEDGRGSGAAADRERRREALEALRDVEARSVGAPPAGDARRDDPEMDA
jgi:hypothetical protein